MKVGDKFIHAFWVTDLQTELEVECVISEISEKRVHFHPTNVSDRRGSYEAPDRFNQVVKRWIQP